MSKRYKITLKHIFHRNQNKYFQYLEMYARISRPEKIETAHGWFFVGLIRAVEAVVTHFIFVQTLS